MLPRQWLSIIETTSPQDSKVAQKIRVRGAAFGVDVSDADECTQFSRSNVRDERTQRDGINRSQLAQQRKQIRSVKEGFNRRRPGGTTIEGGGKDWLAGWLAEVPRIGISSLNSFVDQPAVSRIL
jgi:hypothetical protein